MFTLSYKIQLLKSLFIGREDVFAIRWVKGKQAGYMPAYFFDPYHYRTYKMNGGSFKDYPHKSLLPLTEKEIEKHLVGKHQIGIYPLLKDNTSWFLAADFDGKEWQKEVVLFLNACKEKGISAYLERSRSGNGGHVWIFFEKPYPALKSRKIFLSILEQSGAFSKFDKASSFDRLFPNQDFLSGKGFGNLIALPFYRPTLEQGNSCFIDPDDFKPFSDQWHFLKNINKIPTQVLDELYNSYSENTGSPISNAKPKKLTIYLDRSIHISRVGMHHLLVNYLKQELNFANAEFFAKKKSGRNTYKTKRYFKLIEENENEVILPRG